MTSSNRKPGIRRDRIGRPAIAAVALLALLLGAGGATLATRLHGLRLAAGAGSDASAAIQVPVDGGASLSLPLPPPIGTPGLPKGPEVVVGPAAAPAAAPTDLATFDQIPGRVFVAYAHAAQSLARTDPGCRLPWELVAGIGRIESDHAEGGMVTSAGEAIHRILGPVLDGSTPGVAAIPDTDHGKWDGNKVWDRAVGPMQFIPSSWRALGRRASSRGSPDPENVDDAALTAGVYLCQHGRNLADPAMLRQAVFGYNHSTPYVDAVIAWMTLYAHGVVLVADAGNEPEVRAAVVVARMTSPPPAIAIPIAPAAPAPSLTPPPISAGPTPTSDVPPWLTDPRPSPAQSPNCPAPSASTIESPTQPPSPTGSATPTDTAGPPSPTDTATPTDTPSPTDTPTSSDTSVPVGSPTASPIASPSPEPSLDPCAAAGSSAPGPSVATPSGPSPSPTP
jgi:hypothetical protein